MTPTDTPLQVALATAVSEGAVLQRPVRVRTVRLADGAAQTIEW